MTRPETTLFMLMSVDGKINSGDSDALDVDRDWSRIAGLKEGLGQYYRLERDTDLFSFNTGRVMAKIGVNDWTEPRPKSPVSFVIVDNKPHLTARGVQNLAKWAKHLFVVTANPAHPARGAGFENVTVLPVDDPANFVDLFHALKTEHGIERLTVQSGGNMNARLLRDGLIDHLSLVVAPVLVGGSTTSTVVDGEAIHAVEELGGLKILKLVDCRVLEDSYLHLQYDVLSPLRSG